MEVTEKNPKYFYDLNDFPQLGILEENYEFILNELKSIRQNNKNGYWHTNFPQYVESSALEPEWKAFTFLFYGIKNQINCKACPITYQVLEKIPGLISADFSYLPPHTHIKPHRGFTRMVLRVHLGLIIPKDCEIRVENESRVWQNGKVFIIDDSYEHEAWNNSDEDRFILMIDIVNPLWGYSADEICKYKIENLEDEFLLKLFPKEKWLEFYHRGEFFVD